jgi:coenzyme Q-binding protein COQ10
MPQFSTKRRVQHSAAHMFDLVADVERYPEFVPLCQSLRVRNRTQDSEGRQVIVADMAVAYKLVRQTFTSRVRLDRPKLDIMVEYLEGPFQRMNNRWSFQPFDGKSCDVEFFIAYEFRSRVFAALMGTVFDAAFRRFAAAFERRADEIYGAQSA